MTAPLTVRSLARTLFPIGKASTLRQLVPTYEVHDKRAKMYYPSTWRLDLRKEMKRW